MDWREDREGEPTSSDSPAPDGCPRPVLSSAPATALAPGADPPAPTAHEFSPVPSLKEAAKGPG